MQNLILILMIILSIGCSHKSVQKELPTSPHPCFQAVTKSDLEYFKNNLAVCLAEKTEQGTTPFMLAAARGKDEIVNYFIQQGLDVNATDVQMDTALTYAVVHNQENTVGLLLLAGAQLESKRPDGITPLMMAVQNSGYPVIRALTLTREAVNAVAEDGWTPIYFSIRRKDPNILALLIRQGACVDIIDSYKQTPLDFAKEVGWGEGQVLLKKAPKCGKKKAKA